MEDIRALMAHIEQEQFPPIHRIYGECQRSRKMDPALMPWVKNAIENQRSALDYLAVSIYERFGRAAKGKEPKIYFPFARAPDRFATDIDSRMPGVREARPDLAEVIERHQPFECEWMRWLESLRNEAGHNRLHRYVAAEEEQMLLNPLPAEPLATYPAKRPFAGRSQREAHTPNRGRMEWLFDGPQSPIPTTLETIQASLRIALNEVAEAAGFEPI